MGVQLASNKASSGNVKELPWLNAGYKIFATEGPEAIKIEVLAKKVEISKSSFYHHFADLDVFKTALLNLHLQAVTIITEKERACLSLSPGLLNIFLEHRTDLLFHRQLRINRSKAGYEEYLQKAENIMGTVFIDLVLKALNLHKNKQMVELVYEFAVEGFFLSATPENFNEPWLENYFQTLVKKFLTLNNLNL